MSQHYQHTSVGGVALARIGVGKTAQYYGGLATAGAGSGVFMDAGVQTSERISFSMSDGLTGRSEYDFGQIALSGAIGGAAAPAFGGLVAFAGSKYNMTLQSSIDFDTVGANSAGAASKGLLAQSGDGIALDMFGRNISPRTQSILDRFSNARRVLVEDASGKQSVVQIVDDLGRREAKVSDLGRLQSATGNEFSLLRGPEGQRVLLQGDPTQMMIPEQYAGNGLVTLIHIVSNQVLVIDSY